MHAGAAETTWSLVDVLHRQHLLAERPGLLGRPPATRAALAAGDALAAGAAPHAELQVLLLREGARHLLGRPDGEGELAAGLADGDGGADVLGSDLHVPPGAELPDGQTAAPRPLAAVHRAVLEGGGQVADFGLVNLLVDALLHVLEDDGELAGSCTGKKLGEKGQGRRRPRASQQSCRSGEGAAPTTSPPPSRNGSARN
uniref:Uncharacterized protein n=1 Tax=Anas platyrhynchos TaxID=8839 RepID=A0A8B9SZG8_ANAPL